MALLVRCVFRGGLARSGLLWLLILALVGTGCGSGSSNSDSSTSGGSSSSNGGASPSGGLDYETAFQAKGGHLWTVGSDQHGDWGFRLASGSSPSIAR